MRALRFFPGPSGWTPSPFLLASALLHAAALGGVLLAPHSWPGWVALVVGNHLVLTVAGLLPRSRLLGPNLVRLPASAAARGEVALTFDDGPDPAVTPQVLGLLERSGARASFFCIGERVRSHPELAGEIVRRGHRIENHTGTHPTLFAACGPWRMARQVAQGQRAIEEVTGCSPRFFRAVAGLRNPWLDCILARQGLRLASWTRRGYDTVAGDADVVLARLARGLRAGDVLLLHDGHAARTASGEPVVLVVLPRLLALLEERGLRAVTLADAVATGHPARGRLAA